MCGVYVHGTERLRIATHRHRAPSMCAMAATRKRICVRYLAHTHTHTHAHQSPQTDTIVAERCKMNSPFSHIRSHFSPAHYKFIINSLAPGENGSVREYELQLTAAAVAAAAAALAANRRKKRLHEWIWRSFTYLCIPFRRCVAADVPVCAILCVATAAHRRQTHTHSHNCIRFKRITVIALACKCCSLS